MRFKFDIKTEKYLMASNSPPPVMIPVSTAAILGEQQNSMSTEHNSYPVIEDDSMSEDYSFSSIVEKIWQCETPEEVIRLCTTSEDVIPYLEVFKYRPLDERHVNYTEEIRNMELNQYQEEWWSRLQEQDNRKILWIADIPGGKGKNMFGKWLAVTQEAETVMFIEEGIYCAYEGGEYVYVNITRSMEDDIRYDVLEALKDGMMVSSKHQGRIDFYIEPKLIVFANCEPDRSKMTMDRWEVITYKEDK